MLQFIQEYQRIHHSSPTDAIIAKGLNLSIEQVRARLNNLLNEGQLQYSFTLCGKQIEVVGGGQA